MWWGHHCGVVSVPQRTVCCVWLCSDQTATSFLHILQHLVSTRCATVTIIFPGLFPDIEEISLMFHCFTLHCIHCRTRVRDPHRNALYSVHKFTVGWLLRLVMHLKDDANKSHMQNQIYLWLAPEMPSYKYPQWFPETTRYLVYSTRVFRTFRTIGGTRPTTQSN